MSVPLGDVATHGRLRASAMAHHTRVKSCGSVRASPL
jgi:hypothetical protein